MGLVTMNEDRSHKMASLVLGMVQKLGMATPSLAFPMVRLHKSFSKHFTWIGLAKQSKCFIIVLNEKKEDVGQIVHISTQTPM